MTMHIRQPVPESPIIQLLIPFETTRAVVARQFSLMNQQSTKFYSFLCYFFRSLSEVIETWSNFPETLNQSREQLKEATGRAFPSGKHCTYQ